MSHLLAVLVSLPSQVSEEMSGRLPERLERGLELVDHDRDEAVEGAEEALDAGVTERQVGQRHDGVATNLDARIPRRRRR